MTIIEINKKLYTVPTAWDELSRQQLLEVSDILYACRDNVDDGSYLTLLKIITGMSWFRFFSTKPVDMEEFLYLTFFLVTDNGPVKNIIREHAGLAGPDDDFNNITGDEFVFSEDQYFAFINSKHEDINALNNLVAILYSEKKENYDHEINPDGDVRIPFNQNLCIYNSKHIIKKLELSFKLAVFYYYNGCRHKMIEENPDIFTGGAKETAKYGLLSVMRTIAETGIHGDFDKVQKMYVKMWMMELNEKIEEGKRLEKIQN
jgi:hypothetical protein